MPPQSLRARLVRITGQMEGARQLATAEGLRDVAAAIRELQRSIDLLVIAVERRDRQRVSGARLADAGRAHAEAE